MTRWRILIGFLLAAIFLYFFLRNIDLRELWRATKQGNLSLLLLSALLTLFNYFFRAVRWRYFLLPIKDTGTWNRFTATVIGFAANTIFPAKLGELVRPYLLGTKENISKSAALATVVVERVFDILCILLILVIYLIFLVDPEELSPGARSSLDEVNRAGLVLFTGV